jgi:hypothetical protein
MFPMFAAVRSVPTVKQMQERAQKQQSVWQKQDDMRPMFRPEEICCNG